MAVALVQVNGLARTMCEQCARNVLAAIAKAPTGINAEWRTSSVGAFWLTLEAHIDERHLLGALEGFALPRTLREIERLLVDAVAPSQRKRAQSLIAQAHFERRALERRGRDNQIEALRAAMSKAFQELTKPEPAVQLARAILNRAIAETEVGS